MIKKNQARKWLIPGLIASIGLILLFVATWQYQMLSQVRTHVKNNLAKELNDIGHSVAEKMTEGLDVMVKKTLKPGIDFLSQAETIDDQVLNNLFWRMEYFPTFDYYGLLALYDTTTREVSVLECPNFDGTQWKENTPRANFLKDRLQAYHSQIFEKNATYWEENQDSLLVIQPLAIYQQERFFCMPFFHQGRTKGLLCVLLDMDHIEADYPSSFFENHLTFSAHQLQTFDEDHLQFGLRDAMGQMTFHSVALGKSNFEERIPLGPYSDLLAGYTLDVGFRNTSSSEIADSVYKRNILLWTGLGLLWLILAGFLIHTAYQANRLIRLKSAFVANVSHEFKTPLTSIRMAHDTLAQGRFNSKEEVQKVAAHIGTETQRLEALVYRLLDFGRLESGQSPWKMKPFQLDDWLAGLQELAEQKAADKQFTLTGKFSPTHAQVLGDTTALEQVILILLDNAFKYAAEEPQVDLIGNISGNHFQLDVRDFGPGIPAADQKQVFERFTRLGDADRHDVKGFGLGLAIATEISKAHKGKLSHVQPRDGIGSIFRLEIPLETV